MIKILSSRKNNSMLLTPKLRVLYIFTSMLTTLQSGSHYLFFFFTDVGNKDQKRQVM